ncbi:MAG: hypothetical protein HKN36_07130 [Hellea sp.]|nr:hypothetical protein [Hellea sp.]
MKVRLDTVLAGLLLLAFILPWFSFGPFSMSGLTLATSGLRGILLLLIPASAIFLLYKGYLGESDKKLQIATGAIPLVLIALNMLFGMGDAPGSIFSFLGLGVYITIIAAVAMLLVGLGKIENKTFKE